MQFKDNQGYAIVPKDLRTFPIYAVLDAGSIDARTFSETEMEVQKEKMLAGFKYEVKRFEDAANEPELRNGKNKDEGPNSENAIEEFKADGWRITRNTGIRMQTSWRQSVSVPSRYMDERGAPFDSIHSVSVVTPIKKKEDDVPKSFGCTSVAFGQVMYALRDEAGFRDLTYTNGEKVLWHKMGSYMPYSYDKAYQKNLVRENQRFLGWLTMNCSPTRFGDQTMVFNINATAFLRKKLGNYLHTRYDNCVASDGDFDGYGWAESAKIAEEYFRYPKCFVIMTASSAVLNYFSYHSFVIDGMIEFKKDEVEGTGFLGWGFWKKTHKNGIRHLYHVNAGWGGNSNGYYLYVQNVNDLYKYTGKKDHMDYRSKVAYLVVRPK